MKKKKKKDQDQQQQQPTTKRKYKARKYSKRYERGPKDHVLPADHLLDGSLDWDALASLAREIAQGDDVAYPSSENMLSSDPPSPIINTTVPA